MISDDEPLWIPQHFEEWFDQSIISTYRRPFQFDSRVAPMPFIHAVYGRRGVNKLRLMEHLLKRNEILSYTVVSVELGHTRDAQLNIRCIIDSSVEINNNVVKQEELLHQHEQERRNGQRGDIARQQFEEQPQQEQPIHMIIVDHMDVMIYEPDDEAARLSTLRLVDAAKDARVILIGLFDRTPGDKENISHVAREVHDVFFSKFVTKGFASAPHKTFRIELFKWAIERFRAHLIKSRPIEVNLDELDYNQLANCSTFATPENVIEFLQRALVPVVQVAETVLIDLPYLMSYMHVLAAGHHVCQYDTYDLEERFSQTCGRGIGNRPNAVAQKPSVVDEAPDGGIELGITAFSAKGGTIDGVFGLLGVKKEEKDESIVKTQAEEDWEDNPGLAICPVSPLDEDTSSKRDEEEANNTKNNKGVVAPAFAEGSGYWGCVPPPSNNHDDDWDADRVEKDEDTSSKRERTPVIDEDGCDMKKKTKVETD